MNWSKSQKWDALKAKIICQKKGLLSVLNESKSAKSLDNAEIKKIKVDFNELRNRFLKPKIKEVEKNVLQLVESLFKLKKYYYYDNTEYKGIRNLGNLFNQSIDED